MWLVAIAQTLLFVIAAPLFAGVMKWVKCQLQNREAPPIWQPYLNLNKLFRKEVLIATTTSQLFRIAPYIIFSITIFICAVVPLLIINTPTTAIADVIVIVGLFALARFFLALAGMDTGTAFGGMGSSREMLISTIAEPALLMVFFAVAMTAMSTNLAMIINQLTLHHLWLQPSLIFAALGFILVALAETGRIPVDNPATHLELTMIHEAMILEYSGRYLAFIEWAAQIKFMLYAILFINLFFPWGIANDFNWINIGLGILALVVKLLLLTIILGMAEISLAKLRLLRVPYLLNLAFILGLLAVLIHIIIEVG
ncbi:Formate hydrogenlyase [Gammaproteobacteria bacterium]